MKLGVIGCGKMGTALVAGALQAGVVKAEDVLGTDVFQGARDHFREKTGAEVTSDLSEVISASDIILLCTKPQDAFSAMSDISGDAGEGKLLVSIAAGVTLENLEKHAPGGMRVVRTMPNTPALVGKGAAAYCLGTRCVEGDDEAVQALLASVGMAVQVPEKLMDAVTGLSGSGPAYIYLVIEALADGGVRAGLPRADALKLAAQTVSGAAEMVIQTGEHPAVLKDMVTSPGGTTIAGLTALEDRNVRSAFISAVSAAKDRAVELGRG
ncbi:MAG: pyrroline-5-carboxylate reductase [Luteolibacter sp.]